jgi:hypothetical protein
MSFLRQGKCQIEQSKRKKQIVAAIEIEWTSGPPLKIAIHSTISFYQWASSTSNADFSTSSTAGTTT